MVFGVQKLQDTLFCVTEERDYFQGKYLEQVSEIKALKEQLKNARKEIRKLRGELMAGSVSRAEDDEESSKHVSASASIASKGKSRNSQPTEEHLDAGVLPTEDVEDDDEQLVDNNADNESDRGESEGEDEEENIRKNAAKLLHWADYRTSSSSRLRPNNKSSTCDTSTSPSSTSAQSQRDNNNIDTSLDVGIYSPGDIPRTIPSEEDGSKRFLDDASDLGESEKYLEDSPRGSGSIASGRSLVDRFEKLVTSL